MQDFCTIKADFIISSSFQMDFDRNGGIENKHLLGDTALVDFNNLICSDWDVADNAFTTISSLYSYFVIFDAIWHDAIDKRRLIHGEFRTNCD